VTSARARTLNHHLPIEQREVTVEQARSHDFVGPIAERKLRERHKKVIEAAVVAQCSVGVFSGYQRIVCISRL
jgi:hypothetical protein